MPLPLPLPLPYPNPNQVTAEGAAHAGLPAKAGVTAKAGERFSEVHPIGLKRAVALTLTPAQP